MQNKIKKFLEDWRHKDELLLSLNGGDRGVLQDREYLKQKFRETREFIRKNDRGLNSEEKAWMSMLKSGNRHLEKKLYPNRIVRYSRRMVNAVGNFIKNRLPKKVAIPRQETRFTPTAANNKSTAKATKKSVPVVKRIVQKNKYAALEDIQKSQGMSIKR